MGVVVPPGAHRLELDFEPLHWRLASGLSLAGFAVFAGLLAFDLLRRRAPRAPQSRATP